MKTLRPKRISLQDQILANLRDSELPVPTMEIVRSIGAHDQDVRIELAWLEKRGFVKRITHPDFRSHYWQRIERNHRDELIEIFHYSK